MTESVFMSDRDTWLAMFLCTKIYPGSKPKIVSAGILESEQPIHKY